MAIPTVKVAAAALLALTLGGCNLVYSEKPLFGRADEAGAAALRPGLWATSDPKCPFDEGRPIQLWPTCASWTLVRPGQLLELKDNAWTSTDYVLAGGDPRVMQAPFTVDKGSAYLYGALKPLRLDAGGRVVAFRTWPVLCGPPPEQKPGADKPVAQQRYVTEHPLPGLTIKDNDCLAADQGAVRAAAKASESWESGPTEAHWIRDGIP